MEINNKQFWVFDNNGKTWDRYTIILDDEYGTLLGASENPFSPLGFGQHCGNIPTTMPEYTIERYLEEAREDLKWLGKEIEDISFLPVDVVQFIKQLL